MTSKKHVNKPANSSTKSKKLSRQSGANTGKKLPKKPGKRINTSDAGKIIESFVIDDDHWDWKRIQKDLKRIKDAGVKLSAKGRKRVELDPSFANAMITRRRNRLAWKTLATRDESDQENYDRAQEILETKTRLKKTSIGFVNETIPDDQSASVDARLEKVVKQAAQSIDELTKLPKEIITDRETDEILASIVNDKVSEKHKDSFVDHIRSVPVPTLAAVPDACDHSDQMILFRGYENHVQVCRAFVRDPNKYSSFPISWMTFYRLACRIFNACAKHESLPNENTHDLSKMYRRYIGSEFILRGDNNPYLHVRTENDGLLRVAMCWADIDDLGRGLIKAAETSNIQHLQRVREESEILRKQNEGRKADIERMHKEYGELYKRHEELKEQFASKRSELNSMIVERDKIIENNRTDSQLKYEKECRAHNATEIEHGEHLKELQRILSVEGEGWERVIKAVESDKEERVSYWKTLNQISAALAGYCPLGTVFHEIPSIIDNMIVSWKKEKSRLSRKEYLDSAVHNSNELRKDCSDLKSENLVLQDRINKDEAQRKMDMAQLSDALYGASTIEEMIRCINSLRNEVRTLSLNADQKIKDLQDRYSDLVDAITNHGKPSPVFADIFHGNHLKKAREAGEALDRVKHLEAQIDNVASALGWKSEASKLTPDEIRIELTARIQKMKEILGERRMADYEASLQAERSKLEKREKQYRELVAVIYGGQGCSSNAIDTFHSTFLEQATALYARASEVEDCPKLKELSGLWDQVREAIDMLDDDGEAIVRRVKHLQKSYGEFNVQTVTLGKREHQYRELVAALNQDNEAARCDIDETHETHLSEVHRVVQDHPQYSIAHDYLVQIADALGWIWTDAVAFRRNCKDLLSFVKKIIEKRDEARKEIHDLREQLKSQTDAPKTQVVCTLEEAVDRFTLEEIADLVSERINTRLFQREQMEIDAQCDSDPVVWVPAASSVQTAYLFSDLLIQLRPGNYIARTSSFHYWVHLHAGEKSIALPKFFQSKEEAIAAAEKLYHVLRSIQA